MNGAFRFAGDLFPELTRLQQQLDEALLGSGTTNIRGLARGAFPAVNVGTSPETVEIVAFAPGVDPKALQITVDRGLLVIAGKRDADAGEQRGERDSVHAQERFAGSFRRVISLPEDADPSKAAASFRDGVLHITVNKRESSKPRQIAVN